MCARERCLTEPHGHRQCRLLSLLTGARGSPGRGLRRMRSAVLGPVYLALSLDTTMAATFCGEGAQATSPMASNLVPVLFDCARRRPRRPRAGRTLLLL